jgi:small subunit ribosomal protein S6
MRRDPRVLRWTVLKLADKIEDLARKGEHIGPVQHIEDVVD